MPALELFGRRWHIAADDLPLPSLMGALWHVSVLVLNSVDLAFVAGQLDSSCSYRTKHIVYLCTHLACFVINTVLHGWTFYESIRGTIFQVHRRRRVGPLVMAVIFLYVLTIASNGYGTRLLYIMKDSKDQCDPVRGPLQLNHFMMLEAIVITTWVSLFTGFIAMIITLNFFSTYKATSSPWLSRFKLCRTVCFCCLGSCGTPDQSLEHEDGRINSSTSGGRRQSPMVVIANIFTVVFGGIDMTLTDYTAAFALLGVRHRYSKPALTYANARPPSWLPVPGSSARCAPEQQTGCCGVGGSGDAVLQPPPIVEMAASGGTAGGLPDAQPRPGQAGEAGAEQVTLQVPEEGTPAPSPSPATLVSAAITTTTTNTTTTSDAAASNNATADTPGLDAGARVSANGGAGTYTHTPSWTRADVDSAAGVPPTPGGGEPLKPLQMWDSEHFAEPNASEEVMEEALHYMRFATAVYGWKMYLWMNRMQVTNCCRLCLGRSCGCCRQSSYFIRSVGPDYGPSEGCCSAVKLLEREAITQLTGVPDGDILYVSYDNRVGGLLPYYIALDRTRSSVVVGIRGSLSLSDVITDLLCEPAEYKVPGVPAKDASGRRVLWAHRGMLESTSTILRDIREQGVLQAATAPWPAGEAEQQQLLSQLPSERARAVAQRLSGVATGFRVVITGHSLGAGVTGLLGPLLQQDFPNLRCWAFAPPGGLMSREAAELTRQFCISVVHAKDMISRLGVGTMEALVQDLVRAAVYTRVNKVTIMGRLVLLGQRPPLDEVFHPEGEEPTLELRNVLMKYGSRLKDTPSAKVGHEFESARDFVPPGHVLYVERRKRTEVARPRCTCNICLLDRSAQNCDYVCRWIQVSDLMNVGLVVSRSMFLDHLPDNTLYAFETAIRQMKGDSSPSRPAGTGTPNSGKQPPAPAAEEPLHAVAISVT